MSNPLVLALTLGALAGFAGVALRLFQLAALAAAVAFAWIVATRGVAGVDHATALAAEALTANATTAALFVLGLLLGGAVLRVARRRG